MAAADVVSLPPPHSSGQSVTSGGGREDAGAPVAVELEVSRRLIGKNNNTKAIPPASLSSRPMAFAQKRSKG